MFLMKILGFVLILAIVVSAIILVRGTTKIEKMILAENEQKGDD